ncbi:hypothetical protein PHPALM_30653 [Phytophthora palmivora]|uniref:PiggyBac transposable element-derived protein domain-containing protein n=1 Tax=Phytophthora palmivora TaxID=4796 RepID=A0A2P4X4L6_9STRA|nr:hypothetical protein PHPALM_30653 [Phytophthora palmivora]
MTSEVEGDSSDSESWYVEHTYDDDPSAAQEEAHEVVDEDSSDNELDGEAIAERHRKNAYKRIAMQRLREAVAKLPRDWRATIDNWSGLTEDEMAVLAQDTKALQKVHSDGWNLDPDTFPDTGNYPGLYSGEFGPTEEALSKAKSPLAYFFYAPVFVEQDCHGKQSRLNDRVQGMYQKQRDADKDVTREQIMDAETRKHKKIKGHEIVRCIGLLVARMLCPHSRRLADHWVTSTTGAVPVGTFERYMSKAGFGRIMQNLHFSDNADPRAENDRAWKVRPVVQKLQLTFRAGYKVPPVLAFDEVVIPSRSRHNVTNQYMKDKPHKWGTKLFMTCCANTAYCLRYVCACGVYGLLFVCFWMRLHVERWSERFLAAPSWDLKFSAEKTSMKANWEAAPRRSTPQTRRPQLRDGGSVTDRYYTSVQLAPQLLHRNVYSIGTIQANKAGFPKEVTAEYATRRRDIPRGSTKMAIIKTCHR